MRRITFYEIAQIIPHRLRDRCFGKQPPLRIKLHHFTSAFWVGSKLCIKYIRITLRIAAVLLKILLAQIGDTVPAPCEGAVNT